MKKIWKPKKFIVSWKKILIMVLLIAYYLLVGTIQSVGVEYFIRNLVNQEVTGKERILLIGLWPIVTVVFVFNFLKGFFNN